MNTLLGASHGFGRVVKARDIIDYGSFTLLISFCLYLRLERK